MRYRSEMRRGANWTDYAVASVVRTGKITPEEIKRAKFLQIITRNGYACSFPSPIPLPFSSTLLLATIPDA